MATNAFPSNCVFDNTVGQKYVDFSCVYLALKPFYTKWEIGYNAVPVHRWMQEHNSVPIIVVVLYCILIVVGRGLMKDSNPWKSKPYLVRVPVWFELPSSLVSNDSFLIYLPRQCGI